MDNKLTVFRIGQIVNTQGLKGEVRVYPYTDDINRFDDLEYFYLDKGLNNKYEVERVRYKGNMVIMKIKGIDSIELAQKLKTKNMYIGRDQGKELEEDEFFVADLIGLDVFTVDGEKVTGVKLTESYMMDPVSSVCGLYFASEDSRYFNSNYIDKDQAEDYAKRSGCTLEELEKSLPNILSYK